MKRIIIIILLFFWSCAEKKEVKLHPLKLVKELEYIKNLPDPSILFSMVSELELDTSQQAIFSKARDKAFIDTNSFIVNDYSLLKQFDINGKYIRAIGKRGTGPGEYGHPSFVCNSKLICVYDDMQSKVILYNSSDGSYKHQFNLKYSYNEMLVYKDSLVLMIRRAMGPLFKQFYLDFYNTKGDLVFTDDRIIDDKPNVEGTGPEFRMILNDDLLYIVWTKELIIKCYNINDKGFVWQSIELPKDIKISELTATEANKADIQELTRYNKYANIALVNKNIIVLTTYKKFILYDINGNYLSCFPSKQSVIKTIYPFSDGKYLYEIREPYMGKISNGIENFKLIKYKYEKK